MVGLCRYVFDRSGVTKRRLFFLLPILRGETVIRFKRKLVKKTTTTGTHYTVSIPREIADELKLIDGGLVSLRIWSHRNEVLLQNYDDSILKPYIEAFDPMQGKFVNREVKPMTKGPSRPCAEGRITNTKLCLRELWSAIRFVDRLQKADHRLRRCSRRAGR
mgnify:CR=1 FL=1